MRRYRPATIAIFVAAAAATLAACTAPGGNRPAPSPPADAPSATVAIVIETGSDTGHAAEILAVLRRARVRATFSVTGVWAEQQRHLLLAIAADGHQFINGGYHGTSFTGASTRTPPLTAEERSLELSRTEVTVYHLTGRSTRPYWRPPFGDIDETARRDAAGAGYTTIVLPTFDTDASPTDSAEMLIDRMLDAATPGGILGLHASSPQDAAVLPRLIDALRARGHTPGALEDLPRHSANKERNAPKRALRNTNHQRWRLSDQPLATSH